MTPVGRMDNFCRTIVGFQMQVPCNIVVQSRIKRQGKAMKERGNDGRE